MAWPLADDGRNSQKKDLRKGICLCSVWIQFSPVHLANSNRDFAIVFSYSNLRTSGNFDSVISFLIAMTALGTAGGVIFLVSYHRVSR